MDPEYVAALALTARTREEADYLNQQALELNPDCLIAKLNLDRPREEHKHN